MMLHCDPLLVVIEGIDRCGKNLQANLLMEQFQKHDISVLQHSTPDYTTPCGETIGRYLAGEISLRRRSSGSKAAESPMALQCLQIANRYEVAAKVAKDLRRGVHAVVVRWWQSALIYGWEDGIPADFTRQACSFLPKPDLNILLSVDPDKVSSRLNSTYIYEQDSSVQKRISDRYHELWSQTGKEDPDGSRWVVVPGEGDFNGVSERIWRQVQSLKPGTYSDWIPPEPVS